jgi:LysR family transcriptional regulator, low CO2-responsive transcriptional regulator
VIAQVTEARLRAFVALADTGSVRAAARRLVVTESAVSAAVTALAGDLGVQLVERVGRGLTLTPAGVTYSGYARRILGLLDEGRAAALGEDDPGRGRLRLAAVTTVADQVLPALLAGFRDRWPLIDLALEVGPNSLIWERLATHEADLVLGGRPPAGISATVHATRPNDLVIVAAPGVAFSLETTQWLMREPGSGTRAAAEAYLAGHEVAPPRLVLGSNGAVVAGAVVGLGVTLISRDAVAAELAKGDLVIVDAPGTPLSRPWHAVVGPTPTATTRLFMTHLLMAAGWRAAADTQ